MYLHYGEIIRAQLTDFLNLNWFWNFVSNQLTVQFTGFGLQLCTTEHNLIHENQRLIHSFIDSMVHLLTPKVTKVSEAI